MGILVILVVGKNLDLDVIISRFVAGHLKFAAELLRKGSVLTTRLLTQLKKKFTCNSSSFYELKGIRVCKESENIKVC